MPDDNQGYDAGVRKTPITTDARGRRVRAQDGQLERFPGNQDRPIAGNDDEIAELKASLTAYKTLNDARTITGGGSVFSGNLGSGVKYDPSAVGGPGAGGGGGAGTPTNIYLMGTNNTQMDPLQPQNDSWTLEGGPDPNPDGTVYDGVAFGPIRVAEGNTVGIPGATVTQLFIFQRGEVFSNGILVEVTIEGSTYPQGFSRVDATP